MESRFGPFGDRVICWCKIGARFEPCIPKAQKSFWTQLMVLLGDKAQVDGWFSLFGDSASLNARRMHNFHWTYRRLRNHFRRIRWNSLVTWVMWNLVSVCLETALVSVQDRCTVYAKRSIGPKIDLDTLDGTPRWRGWIGSSIQSSYL
jgi:hypothetical protein